MTTNSVKCVACRDASGVAVTPLYQLGELRVQYMCNPCRDKWGAYARDSQQLPGTYEDWIESRAADRILLIAYWGDLFRKWESYADC